MEFNNKYKEFDLAAFINTHIANNMILSTKIGLCPLKADFNTRKFLGKIFSEIFLF